MWRGTLALLVIVAVGAAAATTLVDDGRRVSLYHGQASLLLPPKWQVIPPEHLDELTMLIADASGGLTVEVYQHGFKPAEKTDDVWEPHLLVQIREGGRLPYGRFLDLEPEGGATTQLPSLIASASLDRLTFDRRRMCILLEHTMDLRLAGRIRVLTASFLTERGTLTLHYSDRERRIAAGRKLFGAIVDSVTMAPDLAYHPRITDRWPGLPFFAAAALMAVLLALVVARRRIAK